jgi:hypothetical protein
MHGQMPTLPMRLRPKLEQPLDFDSPREIERDLLQRSAAVKEMCVMAGWALARRLGCHDGHSNWCYVSVKHVIKCQSTHAQVKHA